MSNTIKIPDYNSVENLNNTDLLLINQNGENKKVTKEKLLEDVTTQIEGVSTSLNDNAQEINSIKTSIDTKADKSELNSLNEQLTSKRILPWGNYTNGTIITFPENVNNYNKIIFSIGTPNLGGTGYIIVPLFKSVNFFNESTNEGTVWKLSDGVIKFKSTTTAELEGLSLSVRCADGIKKYV